MSTEKTTRDQVLGGQVAIVTGSTSGIGRATAETLAAAGASVVVAARRQELGEQVAGSIRETGGQAMFHQADVRSTEQTDALVSATIERFGQIDILVNNAGIVAWGPTHETEDSILDDLVAVNLLGTFWATRSALPHMLDKGSGSIVNLTTTTAARGVPGLAAYSAVKAGVGSLTRTWATEYGPFGIRVNAVAPGVIETPMTEGMLSDEGTVESFRERLPARRVGTPQDVASTVLYLVDPSNSYIHGVTVPVDGGALASS